MFGAFYFASFLPKHILGLNFHGHSMAAGALVRYALFITFFAVVACRNAKMTGFPSARVLWFQFPCVAVRLDDKARTVRNRGSFPMRLHLSQGCKVFDSISLLEDDFSSHECL